MSWQLPGHMEARGTRRSPSFVPKLLLLVKAAGAAALRSHVLPKRQRADFPRLAGRAPAAPSPVRSGHPGLRRSFPLNFVASSPGRLGPTARLIRWAALEEDAASASSMPFVNNFVRPPLSVWAFLFFGPRVADHIFSNVRTQMRRAALHGADASRTTRARRPGPRGSALYYEAAFSSGRRLLHSTGAGHRRVDAQSTAKAVVGRSSTRVDAARVAARGRS